MIVLPRARDPFLAFGTSLLLLIGTAACTSSATPSPPNSPAQTPIASLTASTATRAPERTPSVTHTATNGSPTRSPQASTPTAKPALSPAPSSPTSTPNATWERIGSTTDLQAIAIPAGDGRRIYAGGKGLSRSLDGGTSWETLDSSVEVQDLVTAPSQPQTLYVGATGGCLSGLRLPSFRSDDGGKTLIPIGDNRVSFAIHPQTPDLVYAVDCRLVRSDDAGVTWTELPGATPQNFDATRIAVASSDPRWVYAVGVSEGGSVALQVSSDEGKTWQEASPRRPDGSATVAPSGLAVAPADPKTAYLATWDGVWATRDGGQTWSLSTQGLEVARAGDGAAPYFRLTALAVVPEKPDVVFVGTGWERLDAQERRQQDGFGVFQTNDGGKTWTKVSQGLDGKLIRDLALSPDGTMLYAATNEGLYRLSLP